MKPPELPHITPRERAVIGRMEDLLSGRLPMGRADTVIAPDVVKHMDGYRTVGLEGWHRWFHFLQARGRVSDLSAACERHEKNANGTITLYGRWKGVLNGETVTADDLSVTYRVEGDRIVELWTSRANYVFFFGPIIRFHVGLWIVFAYMLAWYHLSGRFSLAKLLADERPTGNTPTTTP